MSIQEDSLKKHKEIKGKITIEATDTVDNKEKLSLYYTPGVAAVSKQIADHPESARDYTWINNNVAIVSDGSAVLGLGNIGPLAALPVMEGKAMLFKQFGQVNAVPIVINAHTADEIVETVKAIAPSFGGINLEDIAAPICFEVEERLAEELPIPVMHDDQHGTAIVVLAGLINACKVAGKALSECKIVIVGAGAAGIAITKLLNKYAHPNIIAVDSKGIINKDRTDLNSEKQLLLEYTNQDNLSGSLDKAIKDADIFIGVSQPDLLTPAHIKSMKPDPIIFALANPDPEIKPDDAKQAGAKVVATGRSDYPNQVNNALAFPGIFRGALDNNVRQITDEHKMAAAEAIASLIKEPSPDCIIPSIFESNLAETVANVFKTMSTYYTP
jgi:malate dehydrogenase (oxaloacetate-decarboxylating)